MRTRTLTSRVTRLETKFHEVGIIVPDDFEEALRTGKVRARHLEAVFRVYGRDLNAWLIENARWWREKRTTTSYPAATYFDGYENPVEVLSYTAEEIAPERCINDLKVQCAVPLDYHKMETFHWFDPCIFQLRARLAMFVLKTPDALELRGEIHAGPVIDMDTPEAHDDVDREPVPIGSDIAYPTLLNTLFPWLQYGDGRDFASSRNGRSYSR